MFKEVGKTVDVVNSHGEQIPSSVIEILMRLKDSSAISFLIHLCNLANLLFQHFFNVLHQFYMTAVIGFTPKQPYHRAFAVVGPSL